MAISELSKDSAEQAMSKDRVQESEPKDEGDGQQGDNSIDPRNEINGLKLIALHLGLVSQPSSSDWNSLSSRLRCTATPLAGRLFTQFPKRMAYALYVGVFEVGSLVCALAPSSHALIVGHAVAGLGTSGVFAGGLVILTTVIPLHRRAVCQGTFSSTFSVASVVGPVIGGTLTQHVSWRWCFYINLPIGVAAAIIVLLTLNVHPSEAEAQGLGSRLKSLDVLGFALFAGAVVMLLLLALQWGGVQYAWGSSVVLRLFVGAGVTLPLFITQQIRLGDRALIPPRVFLNRIFALIFILALFSSGSFQTVVYWLPIWFQGCSTSLRRAVGFGIYRLSFLKS